MSEPILQITNLAKNQRKTILDHISFEVGQGAIVLLIRLNGAGKTTLMSTNLFLVTKLVAVKSLSGQRLSTDQIAVPSEKYHSLTIKS